MEGRGREVEKDGDTKEEGKDRGMESSSRLSVNQWVSSRLSVNQWVSSRSSVNQWVSSRDHVSTPLVNTYLLRTFLH